MPRLSLRLTTATLALLAGLAAPLTAQEAASEGAKSESSAPAAAAQEDAGAYLAARVAESHGDFLAAATAYDRALSLDPKNPHLLNGALFAHLNLGNLERAAALAELVNAAPREVQLVDFALLADAARREDYAALAALLGEERAIGPLFDKLALAWAEIGQGRMSEGLAHFDRLAETRGFEAYGLFHKALALAMAGDFEGAEHILSGDAKGALSLNRRGVVAYAQILSQLERGPQALEMIEKVMGEAPEPMMDDLREKLRAGETLPFDSVRSARDGVAEVFFSLSTLLSGEADPAITLLNARAALALRPDHLEAALMSASLMEALNQYDRAVEIYATIPKDQPGYYGAELGRADALHAAGHKEEALDVLRALAKAQPNLLMVQAALADKLRNDELWDEAETAYNSAIALVEPKPEAQHWVLYFTRGIVLERLKRLDESEADMRRALELNPGQPQVLNYLGYSMLERGKNLDEALALIEEAVKAQPEAGYIIDSLAWGYFLLGRYQDAVVPMEKASLLEPLDAVVTDHLADVYWMNGRKREAEFQWRRALSFGPEEDDAARIRKKLELGLDAVMAEEAASKTNGN